jgi:hypothetical protein
MLRLIEKRCIILCPLFLFLLGISCAQEPEEGAKPPEKVPEEQTIAPEEQIKAYQEAHNSGDVEKKLSCCAEDARYEVEGLWDLEGKQDLRRLFESDAVLNSRIVLTDLKVEGNKITCKIEEESDWLKLAGIGVLNYESGQFTFEKGLIKEVRVKYTPASNQAVQEYAASFGNWASENRSQEFAELQRTGLITKETVGLYLRLLREWQADIKKQEDINKEEDIKKEEQ